MKKEKIKDEVEEEIVFEKVYDPSETLPFKLEHFPVYNK